VEISAKPPVPEPPLEAGGPPEPSPVAGLGMQPARETIKNGVSSVRRDGRPSAGCRTDFLCIAETPWRLRSGMGPRFSG